MINLKGFSSCVLNYALASTLCIQNISTPQSGASTGLHQGCTLYAPVPLPPGTHYQEFTMYIDHYQGVGYTVRFIKRYRNSVYK